MTMAAEPPLTLGASVPSAGSEPPEFTLPSREARWSGSKDYRGKSVALYFYPKDFTSGCTIGAHNFQRDQALYQGKSAVVLGVSVDSAGSHKQFCARQGLNFN
jgi:peroxiredoxin Q/BCP